MPIFQPSNHTRCHRTALSSSRPPIPATSDLPHDFGLSMSLINKLPRLAALLLPVIALACSDASSPDHVETGGDTQAPAIAITTPSATGTFGTTDNSVVVAGTASDNVGVTQVAWAND